MLDPVHGMGGAAVFSGLFNGRLVLRAIRIGVAYCKRRKAGRGTGNEARSAHLFCSSVLR